MDGATLQVCFSRMSACGDCGMCGSGRNDAIATVKGNAQVGDSVEVEMPDAQVLKASVLTYLVPLAGLILGLVFGSLLFPGSDTGSLVMGLGLLLVGLMLVKLLDRHLGKRQMWQPRIIAVYPAQSEGMQQAEAGPPVQE